MLFNYMLLTIIYYVDDATQCNDGRQRNVRRCSVCDCCRRNRLQRRRFSLVTNIVAVTRLRTGCESSCKFLETQVISSSLDGRTVAWRPARWGGWSSALITLSSAVLSLSLCLTTTFPLSPCCLYIGMSLVPRRWQPAIYASEQVCIGWHRTGACYIDKLTFSHGSSIKVKGAYYIRILTVLVTCRALRVFRSYFIVGVQFTAVWLSVVYYERIIKCAETQDIRLTTETTPHPAMIGSGWTMFAAMVQRQILMSVYTTAGVYTTVNTGRMLLYAVTLVTADIRWNLDWPNMVVAVIRQLTSAQFYLILPCHWPFNRLLFDIIRKSLKFPLTNRLSNWFVLSVFGPLQFIFYTDPCT